MHGPGTLKQQSDSTKWGMTREQTVEIVKRAQAMPHIQLKETHFHLSRMSNDPTSFAVMAREMITWSGYIRDNDRLDAALHRHRRRLDLRQMVRHRPATASSTTPRRRRPRTMRASAARRSRRRPRSSACRCRSSGSSPAARSPARPASRSARSARSSRATRKKWVNLDLSTNHLSWAAVLDWYYHAVPVVNAGREATETVDLVGPLCNSDEVGPHRKMPPLKRGDYVAFLDAGGYTESCAARYNAQLLPATVLVAGDRAEIITEREQLKDIAGRFRVPPRLLAGSFAPYAAEPARMRISMDLDIAAARPSSAAAARASAVPPPSALAREGVDVTLVARTPRRSRRRRRRSAPSHRRAACTPSPRDVDDDGRPRRGCSPPAPSPTSSSTIRACVRRRPTSARSPREDWQRWLDAHFFSSLAAHPESRAGHVPSGRFGRIVNMSVSFIKFPQVNFAPQPCGAAGACRAPSPRWCAS